MICAGEQRGEYFKVAECVRDCGANSCAAVCVISLSNKSEVARRSVPKLLQKSKAASVRSFDETLIRDPVDDSDNLSRASEVAYEFCVRR
jgi:hypothetical protein